MKKKLKIKNTHINLDQQNIKLNKQKDKKNNLNKYISSRCEQKEKQKIFKIKYSIKDDGQQSKQYYNRIYYIESDKRNLKSTQSEKFIQSGLRLTSSKQLIKSAKYVRDQEKSDNKDNDNYKEKMELKLKKQQQYQKNMNKFSRQKQIKRSNYQEQKRQLYYGNTTTSNHTKRQKYYNSTQTKFIKTYKQNHKQNSKSKSKDSKNHQKSKNSQENHKILKNSNKNKDKSKNKQNKQHHHLIRIKSSHHLEKQDLNEQVIEKFGSLKLFGNLNQKNQTSHSREARESLRLKKIQQNLIKTLEEKLQSKQDLFNTIQTKNLLESTVGLGGLVDDLREWEYRRLKKIHQAEQQMLQYQILKIKKEIRQVHEQNNLFVDSNHQIISLIESRDYE